MRPANWPPAIASSLHRKTLKARAYEEAASQLFNACDRIDLGNELSEDEESFVREFMRNVVTARLRKTAGHYR